MLTLLVAFVVGLALFGSRPASEVEGLQVSDPDVALAARTDIADGHRVLFHDDFSGEELDEVWNTCHWWQVDGGCTIESNDEQQWYRPEAVSVGEGVLRLTASDDEQETTDGDELPYRSGMVTTGPSHEDDDSPGFAFTYGTVSVRARLPEGEGTWPAVWLLSANKRSLPEIDIFEWYGGRPGVVTSHVHTRVDDERRSRRVQSEHDDLSRSWHTFTVRWEPDEVVFEIDGVETGRVTDPELIPSSPMYLVANLALGGRAGSVDDDVLPQSLLIDEILVTQECR